MKKKRNRGYTLFEVLLSLILLTAILAMIATAIRTHLFQLNAGRMQTEEARLARAIFDKITYDIRNVVQEIESEQSSESQEATTTGTETTDTEADANVDYDETSENDLTAPPEYGFVGIKPGIYGGTDWIQIDSRRQLFGERFEDLSSNTYNMIEQEETQPRFSTRKVTLYFLGEETGTQDADDEILKNASGSIAAPESPDEEYEKSNYRYGLYMRSLDRLVAEYALDNGLETDLEEEDVPFAPEVDDIEFQYYDGEEWLSEWDMDIENELPTAIQVILSIRRKDYDPMKSRSRSTSSDQFHRVVTYSLTIPTSLELVSTSESEDEESDSGNSSSGNN